MEPGQRPPHRNRKQDQRNVRRDLGHQQSVIERGFRHQHGHHHRAEVMRCAPDNIGEQNLRKQHRDNASEAYTQICVAEDRGAEANEPRDHRRVIEKRKHALL